MGTRKNKHQSKWALGNWGKRAVWANGCLEQMGMWKLGQMDVWGIMGTLGQMGTLGSMSFGPSRHWGQMCTWGKWAPGKMSTRVNRQLGHNGHFEKKGYLGQIGVESLWGLGQMSIWD